MSAVPVNRKSQKILAAAKKLFTENGYGATSMDAVTARAGVSKATVYAHFTNKEKLFAAMVQQECQRLLRRLAIPEDVDDLAVDVALTHIARAFVKAVLEPSILAIFRAVIAEAPRFPELGVIFYDSGPGVTVDGLTQYLQKASDSGLIETVDTRLAARQFLGMLRGDLQLRALLGITESIDIDDVADTAVKTFLQSHQAPRS